MFTGIAIDVALLAVLIPLHITNRGGDSKNLKVLELGIIIAIISHVLFTSDLNEGIGGRFSSLGAEGDDIEDDIEEEETIEVIEKNEDGLGDQNEPANTIDPKNVQSFQKNVSDSEFTRQFNIPPETTRTSTIFPASSNEANSKLARSRSSFYDGIL